MLNGKNSETIQEDVTALIDAFEDRGSLYAEESGKLVDPGHDDIYPDTVIDGIRSIDSIGCSKVLNFVTCVSATM